MKQERKWCRVKEFKRQRLYSSIFINLSLIALYAHLSSQRKKNDDKLINDECVLVIVYMYYLEYKIWYRNSLNKMVDKF